MGLSAYVVYESRHNPLGKVFSRSELVDIGALCVKHKLLLLSDEVYERIAFARQPYCSRSQAHTRVASVSPDIAARTLTAFSFGKIFEATGWRVGFVAGPEHLMKRVIATHLVLAYSSSGPAQQAFALGLREADRRDWWTANSNQLAARIDKICAVLDEVGLTVSAEFSFEA